MKSVQICNSVILPIPKVLGGLFRMGSSNGDSDEKPIHRVKVSTFWIAESEVTVGQYFSHLKCWYFIKSNELLSILKAPILCSSCGGESRGGCRDPKSSCLNDSLRAETLQLRPNNRHASCTYAETLYRT